MNVDLDLINTLKIKTVNNTSEIIGIVAKMFLLCLKAFFLYENDGQYVREMINQLFTPQDKLLYFLQGMFLYLLGNVPRSV